MGAAGITGLVPFYLMAPGADERMSKQTHKWAPRWERNISHFKSPAEKSIQRVTPPIERAVHRLEERLPLERAAKGSERSIKKALDMLGVKHS